VVEVGEIMFGFGLLAEEDCFADFVTVEELGDS